MIWYNRFYDTIQHYDMIQQTLWYDKVYFMIWYNIIFGTIQCTLWDDTTDYDMIQHAFWNNTISFIVPLGKCYLWLLMRHVLRGQNKTLLDECKKASTLCPLSFQFCDVSSLHLTLLCPFSSRDLSVLRQWGDRLCLWSGLVVFRGDSLWSSAWLGEDDPCGSVRFFTLHKKSLFLCSGSAHLLLIPEAVRHPCQ